MITQDEAVSAVNLMINSLNYQAHKFPHPEGQYLLVPLEIAQHLSDYATPLLGIPKRMFSGDEFMWRGFKCKVA